MSAGPAELAQSREPAVRLLALKCDDAGSRSVDIPTLEAALALRQPSDDDEVSSSRRQQATDQATDAHRAAGLQDMEELDAAGVYAAVKPPQGEVQLQASWPQLRPQLRPYQRRAASWMVQREKGFLVRPHSCRMPGER